MILSPNFSSKRRKSAGESGAAPQITKRSVFDLGLVGAGRVQQRRQHRRHRGEGDRLEAGDLGPELRGREALPHRHLGAEEERDHRRHHLRVDVEQRQHHAQRVAAADRQRLAELPGVGEEVARGRASRPSGGRSCRRCRRRRRGRRRSIVGGLGRRCRGRAAAPPGRRPRRRRSRAAPAARRGCSSSPAADSGVQTTSLASESARMPTASRAVSAGLTGLKVAPSQRIAHQTSR